MSGPLPNTKTRKLLTPGILVNPDCATSAMPLAIGKVPVPAAPGPPAEGAVHESKAPEQSAKLITIEGVPLANAEGAVNGPCANCSKLTAPGTNDAATAAYNTLHGPAVMETMLPKVAELPE